MSRGFVLAFLVATSLEKLVAIWLTGFNDDEAYTVVIARRLALSYFDHPPLHQWLAHATAALFGEGPIERLPFLFLIVALNLPLYGLTTRLYGSKAGWAALLAFNATAYFLIVPDGFIMPDPPLLLALAFAAWAVAEIVFAPADEKRAGGLWLAAGLAFGLAGLSKYSAVFGPIGLLGFLLTTPSRRRWLVDARPFAGGLVALVVISPAMIWNAENHWVSFAFQGHRATGALAIGVKALEGIGGSLFVQLLLLSPWIAVPLLAGLARALRERSEADRFLLWLALPPVIFFTLLPLVGQRAIPHWYNSGWLFAFPLAGRWLAESSERWRMGFPRLVAGLAVAIVGLYLLAVHFSLGGWPIGMSGKEDPTRYAYDWPDPRMSRLWAQSPDFVVVGNWRVGGRLGVALGPDVPICLFGGDPRGFAFACRQDQLIGKRALIAGLEDRPGDMPKVDDYFDGVSAPEAFPVGRLGRAERWLRLSSGETLKRPYPLPYGP